MTLLQKLEDISISWLFALSGCKDGYGTLAFITSANLTSAAMERNMELGVLVKGGELPFELHRHLEALISAKVIEKVNEDNDQ